MNFATKDSTPNLVGSINLLALNCHSFFLSDHYSWDCRSNLFADPENVIGNYEELDVADQSRVPKKVIPSCQATGEV